MTKMDRLRRLGVILFISCGALAQEVGLALAQGDDGATSSLIEEQGSSAGLILGAFAIAAIILFGAVLSARRNK